MTLGKIPLPGAVTVAGYLGDSPQGLRVEGASLIGDLLLLLAAMGFGAYTVPPMRVLGRYSTVAMATYPTPFGGPLGPLLSVPFLTGVGGACVQTWVALVFSAVFATALAFSA